MVKMCSDIVMITQLIRAIMMAHGHDEMRFMNELTGKNGWMNKVKQKERDEYM